MLFAALPVRHPFGSAVSGCSARMKNVARSDEKNKTSRIVVGIGGHRPVDLPGMSEREAPARRPPSAKTTELVMR